MKTMFAEPSLRRVYRIFTVLFMLAPLAQVHAASISGLVDKAWIEIDSPHFRVVTEQPEDVARRMILSMSS